MTSPNQSPSPPAPIRLISAGDVAAALPMSDCIEAVEAAFLALARGEAEQPLRTVIRLPDGESSFLAMPAALGSPRTLGAKLLTLFPRNHGRGVPSHQGVIVTFDPDDGSLSAVVDAGPVTAIRTAAASAVATRALARHDASELAVLGSGVQARTHVEAMLAVRPVRRVRAWSPNRDRLTAFVAEIRDRHGVAAEASASSREAVEGADLVCTVTSSSVPVLEGAWLAPGAHVNAVGASTPTTRELDAGTVALSRFFVDRRESALAEAGDWILARDEGAVTDADLAGEVGEVLLGTVPGRTDPAGITVFKSLGLAIQDLAAVACMVRKGASAS